MSEGERAHTSSIKVQIFNQTYSLRASVGGEERVLRVARAVDERMRLIGEQLAVHDVAKVAVLTALNFADELQAYKEHYENAQQSPSHSAEETHADDSNQTTAQSQTAPKSNARSGSWFDTIFDADAFDEVAGDRMTSRLTSKLQGQRQQQQQARREQPSDDERRAGRDADNGEGKL